MAKGCTGDRESHIIREFCGDGRDYGRSSVSNETRDRSKGSRIGGCVGIRETRDAKIVDIHALECLRRDAEEDGGAGRRLDKERVHIVAVDAAASAMSASETTSSETPFVTSYGTRRGLIQTASSCRAMGRIDGARARYSSQFITCTSKIYIPPRTAVKYGDSIRRL